MNNLKMDSNVGETFPDLAFELQAPTYVRLNGANDQRELVKQVLDSRIWIRANNFILFDGSILDLAIVYLRDLPTLPPSEI